MLLAALVTIVGVPSIAGRPTRRPCSGITSRDPPAQCSSSGSWSARWALLELIMLVVGPRSLARRRYAARSCSCTPPTGNPGRQPRPRHAVQVPTVGGQHGRTGVLTRARQRQRGTPRWHRAGRAIHNRLTRRETETACGQPIDTKSSMASVRSSSSATAVTTNLFKGYCALVVVEKDGIASDGDAERARWRPGSPVSTRIYLVSRAGHEEAVNG